ncbi:MAG: FimB/Mfa2 family fimbrial subunit [Prevotella sp.]|nr:FimB/Mfa2 family fimbrial subunit [Prevotella sp.]
MMGMICVCVISCEKISVGEDSSLIDNVEKAKVKLRISMYTQTPLETVSRRVKVSVKDACTRISYAIFEGENKIKAVNQAIDDDGFGTLSFTLPLGTYQLVVVGHQGLGNATISSPQKITFANNKCTDTFYAYQEFSLTEDTEIDVLLKRAVALFRLVVEDEFPAIVTDMKFYYTGGSSTFDAVSGYGCVNSKQTEYRDVTEKMRQSGGMFDLYTFPHKEKDTLKMIVTALTSSDETYLERTFPTIPVEVNSVTQYAGTFFGSSTDEGDLDLHFEVDTTWVQYSKYHY